LITILIFGGEKNEAPYYVFYSSLLFLPFLSTLLSNIPRLLCYFLRVKTISHEYKRTGKTKIDEYNRSLYLDGAVSLPHHANDR
jgi:hypothetical protein